MDQNKVDMYVMTNQKYFPVKRISKSGLPIFFIQALIFGYTFALQENVSHISIYCRTIHSFPPNITTLIFMSSPVFG